MTNSTGKSLLLVEDDGFIASMLSRCLIDGGYEVRHVTTGEDCLAAIAERRPDILLLDIGLPGIDGHEVMERLRADEATRSLSVLVVSNFGQPEDIEKSKQLGAVDHLIKANVEPREILARVNEVVRNTS